MHDLCTDSAQSGTTASANSQSPMPAHGPGLQVLLLLTLSHEHEEQPSYITAVGGIFRSELIFDDRYWFSSVRSSSFCC